MTKILVQPQQLRQTAEQLRSHAQKIDLALRAIDDDIRSLKGHHFLGHRADSVQVHYAPKREALLSAKELVLRFSSELDATATVFEKADAKTTSISSPDPTPTVKAKLKSADIKAAHKDFNAQWKEWTIQERTNYLSKIYDAISEEYGIEWITLSIENLPDPTTFFGLIQTGDLRGQFFPGDRIAIDSDNLAANDGVGLINTLAHEIRHQVQLEMVYQYQEFGEGMDLPSGVTLEQVKAWEENFENYIPSSDDYEGYRKQPIEQDARDFAGDYIDRYLVENM